MSSYILSQDGAVLVQGDYTLTTKDISINYFQSKLCVNNAFTGQGMTDIALDDVSNLIYTPTLSIDGVTPVIAYFDITSFNRIGELPLPLNTGGIGFRIAIDNVKNNVMYIIDGGYCIRVLSLIDYSVKGVIMPPSGKLFTDVCINADGTKLFASTGYYNIPYLISYETKNYNVLNSTILTSAESGSSICFDPLRKLVWTYVSNGDVSTAFQALDENTLSIQRQFSAASIIIFGTRNTLDNTMMYDKDNDIIIHSNIPYQSANSQQANIIICSINSVLANAITTYSIQDSASFAKSDISKLFFRIGENSIDIYK